MTIKANPTDARTLALYFLEQTVERFTSHVIARTVNQVKHVLSQGYTIDEIKQVIDYTLARKADVYSFGYISACMSDALREIESQKVQSAVQEEIQIAQVQLASAIEERRNEANVSDGSTERNRNKARRIGIQSRFGKKFNFDMFEGK